MVLAMDLAYCSVIGGTMVLTVGLLCSVIGGTTWLKKNFRPYKYVYLWLKLLFGWLKKHAIAGIMLFLYQ